MGEGGTGALASDLHELGRRYDIPVIDTITDGMLDEELISGLPVEWARQNRLLPVQYGGKSCVLTEDPGRLEQIQDLELLLSLSLTPVLASADTILAAIERCYYSRSDTAEDFLKDMVGEDAGTTDTGSSDLLQVSDQAPVSQLANLILLEAVKAQASDIHIEPFDDRLRIRYRVDGVLYEQTSPPKHMEAALISRIKVLGQMDIAEKRLPQDGMTRVRVGDREVDIRLSTVPISDGERIVMRLLDRERALLPLSQLGMSDDIHAELDRHLSAPNGLILVTGPTGSGKTTTLYAALGTLDASRLNILTIEDPVEYRLPNIGQIQVKPKIGLTFANGLRHILRQDPDVVLVGETRDSDTAEIAVRASLTGHLVFTTLHTNDAASAIVRICDMGIEPYLLASSLRAVVAQRLVRMLCSACREQYSTVSEEFDWLAPALRPERGMTAFRPVGCKQCRDGYSGRVAIYEIMSIDEAMQNEIRNGAGNIAEMRNLCRASGMRPMIAEGLEKIASGLISVGELRAVMGSDVQAAAS